jgi:dihydroflavonol-4-reductase
VRGTVRSIADPKKFAELTRFTGPTGHKIEFVAATLDSDAGWDDAVRGVTYIQHVASPVPTEAPKNGDADVVQPAIKGVQFVLRAALKASVRRVILTSSVSAVFEGRWAELESHEFTEEDWYVFQPT